MIRLAKSDSGSNPLSAFSGGVNHSASVHHTSHSSTSSSRSSSPPSNLVSATRNRSHMIGHMTVGEVKYFDLSPWTAIPPHPMTSTTGVHAGTDVTPPTAPRHLLPYGDQVSSSHLVMPPASMLTIPVRPKGILARHLASLLTQLVVVRPFPVFSSSTFSWGRIIIFIFVCFLASSLFTLVHRSHLRISLVSPLLFPFSLSG